MLSRFTVNILRTCWAHWQHLADSMGRYLTPLQAQKLHDAGNMALQMHYAASWEGASQGELAWLHLPKMHLADHCDQDVLAFAYNPRFFANWQGEDFMGSLKKLCVGTLAKGMELRVLRRCLIRVHSHKGGHSGG